jgi:hypothetical protein
MSPPTPADPRAAQTPVVTRYHDVLADARNAASNDLARRQKRRADLIADQRHTRERYSTGMDGVYAAYQRALEQVMALANAHLLVLDEMREAFRREWKAVKRGSEEMRARVLERKVRELGSVVQRYERDVEVAYREAGMEYGDGDEDQSRTKEGDENRKEKGNEDGGEDGDRHGAPE